VLLVTLPHHISKDVIPTREYSPRWENITDGVDDSFFSIGDNDWSERCRK